MRCPKIKRISAYLDGEMDQREKTLLESHLQECVQCARGLEEMRKVHGLFADVERQRAPYGFSARIVTRAAAQTERGPRWVLSVLTKFAEVVAILAVITVGVASGRLLMNSIMNRKTTTFASSLSLEVFDPAPPDSVGGAYLAMMGVDHEK